MNPVKTEFDSICKQVYPGVVLGEVQRQELERMFFAGVAFAALASIAIECENDEERKGITRQMWEECKVYFHQLSSNSNN